MIGKLNHVAIAVRDIGKAAGVYRDVLGAEVSAAVPQISISAMPVGADARPRTSFRKSWPEPTSKRPASWGWRQQERDNSGAAHS
jgi:catechol 2,3-dioxygenase-like lactoylglutathione lyase family enzyme